MKQSAFVVFISIVLVIYSAVNYYIYIKGFRTLPDKTVYKYLYTVLFIFLSLQFVISRIILLTDIPFQPGFVFFVGGIWFAAVLYFLLFILGIELFSLINKYLQIITVTGKLKFYSLIFVTASVSLLMFIGYFNATSPKLKEINLKINKKSDLPNLRIAQISDVHFGAIIGYSEIKNMLEVIESQKPDILLITGDFADEGITKERIDKIKPLFEKIQPKFGKIAILGNHEYYNHIERTEPVFKQLGVKLLRDDFLTFENNFIIAGRDDKTVGMLTGTNRKLLAELFKNVDFNLPVILLDHQPNLLSETSKFPVDLQLSGHTHYGQMIPITFITKLAFEVSWGYLQKGNTQFYVTSGFGTWGPRIRLGTDSEIVIINLTFQKK